MAQEDLMLERKSSSKIIQELKLKVAKGVEGVTEMQRLKDEIDVLSSTSNKVTKLESSIEKYRERLEEAAGIKEQKKKVEHMNTELVQKNLDMELQLKNIPILRKKVEDYKVSNSDMVFYIVIVGNYVSSNYIM